MMPPLIDLFDDSLSVNDLALDLLVVFKSFDDLSELVHLRAALVLHFFIRKLPHLTLIFIRI